MTKRRAQVNLKFSLFLLVLRPLRLKLRLSQSIEGLWSNGRSGMIKSLHKFYRTQKRKFCGYFKSSLIKEVLQNLLITFHLFSQLITLAKISFFKFFFKCLD